MEKSHYSEVEAALILGQIVRAVEVWCAVVWHSHVLAFTYSWRYSQGFEGCIFYGAQIYNNLA